MAQRRHLRSAAGHARRAVWTHVAFGCSLYSVRDCGTLSLDCCVTLATALLALDILWRHFCSKSTSVYRALGLWRLCANKSTFYLLTYWRVSMILSMSPRMTCAVLSLAAGYSTTSTRYDTTERCQPFRRFTRCSRLTSSCWTRSVDITSHYLPLSLVTSNNGT